MWMTTLVQIIMWNMSNGSLTFECSPFFQGSWCTQFSCIDVFFISCSLSLTHFKFMPRLLRLTSMHHDKTGSTPAILLTLALNRHSGIPLPDVLSFTLVRNLQVLFTHPNIAYVVILWTNCRNLCNNRPLIIGLNWRGCCGIYAALGIMVSLARLTEVYETGIWTWQYGIMETWCWA